MHRLALVLALPASAIPATAQDANPVLGTWDWNPVRGECHEVHTYRGDGTAQTRSGSEVLEKTYTVTPGRGGTFVVAATVVSGNGGKDCLGATTAIGATSTVTIRPLNEGGYFTCASDDGMSCYGSARPAKAE